MTRQANVLCLLTLMILLFVPAGCVEDETTEPDVPVDPPDATATIGADGGSLIHEDIILTVPGGAFSSTADLELYVEEDEDPFGETGVSKIYRIDALPGDYQLPLEVTLRYSGTLSGESFIAIGQEITIDTPDTSFIGVDYSLIAAEEALGFLSGEIPAPTTSGALRGMKTSISSDISVFLGAFTDGGSWPSPNGNFLAEGVDHLPASQRDYLLGSLEEAHTRFRDLQFDYSRATWPMKVTIVFSHAVDEHETLVFRSTNGIGVRVGHLPEFEENRVDIEYAFCRAILFTYQVRDEDDWIRRSIPVWSTYKFEGWDESSSNALKQSVAASLDGFPGSPLTEDAIFGASLLLEYLVESYGEGILSGIMADIDDDIYAIDAIINRTGEPEGWLTAYHQYLMTDERFGDLLEAFWRTEMDDSATINNSTVDETFTDTFRDFSGKWYKIDLATDIEDDAALKCTLDGSDAELTVYKFKSGELEYVGATGSGFTLNDIGVMADEGWDLYALVTNNHHESPYQGSTEIELKLELILLESPSRINFSLKVDGTIHIVRFNGDEYDDTGSFTIRVPDFNEDAYYNVTVIDDTYVQTWDVTDDDDAWSGTVTVVLDKEQRKIVSYELSAQETDRSGVTTVYAYCANSDLSYINATDVMGSYTNGEEVCDNLDEIDYRQVAHEGPGREDLIQPVECQRLSRLMIEIVR